jgi:ABC-type multidrug transport system fused ATPase/permease subunit
VREDLRTLITALRRAGARPRRLVASAILSGLADTAGLGVASLLLVLVHAIVADDLSRERFAILATGVYGLILVKNALDYASERILVREASAATQQLRRELFARYLAADKAYFDATPTSAMRDAMMNATAAPAGMVVLFHRLLTKTISCLIVVGYLVRLSWLLALVAISLAPLANLVIAVMVKRIRAQAHRYAAARGTLGRTVHEQLTGMVQVHAATAEQREADRLGTVGEVERGLALHRSHLEQLVAPARELAATSTLLAIAWCVGLVHTGLAVAELFVFVYLVQRLMNPLAAIGDARLRIASGSPDLARLDRLLEVPPAATGTRAFDWSLRRIAISGLTFGYPDRAAVLRGASLELPAGTVTALVGASGSGKTTLLQLLFGFYDPPIGTIQIDSVDLRELDRGSWRRRVAYVTQDAFLFDAPLRDNLLYATERTLTDAELVALLRRLGLDDFLARLEAGLDTVVGERGCRVSGGEKQRLALARAIVRDADVYLLDEVTSSLDEATARLVGVALRELLAGKTVIIASHRPSVLAHVDQIVELRKGFVVTSEPARRAVAD